MGYNHALNTNLDLYVVNCGNCGGVYAILEQVRAQKYQEGGSWNCPYCDCGWGYANSGENARLKRELEQERKRKEWAEQDAKMAKERAEQAEYRRRAQKAVTTRIKNRIAKGVCPCCKRTFQNLAQHMANQHPNFAVSGKEG